MSQADFDAAAAAVKQLTQRPSNDELLQLYGLFKQVTVGDNNTDRPGTFSLDFEGKAKWDAWKANEGLSKDAAIARYIELVNSLKGKYS